MSQDTTVFTHGNNLRKRTKRFFVSDVNSHEELARVVAFGREIGTLPLNERSRYYGRHNVGGYTYPALDEGARISGEGYTLVHLSAPVEDEDYAADEYLTNRPDYIKSMTAGDTVTFAFGAFTLEETLDLHAQIQFLLNDDEEVVAVSSKTDKRLASALRPFLLHNERKGGFTVLVLKDDEEYEGLDMDGAFVYNARIVQEAVTMMPADPMMGFEGQLMRQEAAIASIKGGNVRVWGKVVAGDPDEGREYLESTGHGDREIVSGKLGTPLPIIIKGNGWPSYDMPEGIDVITTEANCKEELYGGSSSLGYFGVEKQSSKLARLNKQDKLTHPARMTDERTMKSVKFFGNQHLEAVKDGSIFFGEHGARMEKLLDRDTQTFAMEEAWLFELLSAMKFNLHWSPWLTKRAALSYVAELGLEPHSGKFVGRLRVPITYAVRAQIISESLARLMGVKVQVDDGYQRWSKELDCFVVTDRDWVYRIICNAGGADADDSWTILQFNSTDVTDTQVYLFDLRNPNTRGEYSIMKGYADDPIHNPLPGRTDGKLPKIDMAQLPPTVMDSIDNGTFEYKDLPSEAPDAKDGLHKSEWFPYTGDHVLAAEKRILETGVAGPGGYMNAEWIFMTTMLEPTELPKSAFRQESVIDLTTGNATPADQTMVALECNNMLDQVEEAGVKVDPILWATMPKEYREAIRKDDNGPLVTLGRAIEAYVREYNSEAEEFSQSRPMPDFLQALAPSRFSDGTFNRMKSITTTMVKDMRRAYPEIQAEVFANYADVIAEARGRERNRLIQSRDDEINRRYTQSMEDTILNNIGLLESDSDRAQLMLNLWASLWENPTKSSNRLEDRAIWGTKAKYHMLDALVLFGIIERPIVKDVSERFTVNGYEVVNPRYTMEYADGSVKYLGDGVWHISCPTCNRESNTANASKTAEFIKRGSTCKVCSAQ